MVHRRWAHRVAVAALATDAVVAVWAMSEVLDSGSARYSLGGWQPPIGIELLLDPLSVFFAVVVAGIATVVLFGADDLLDGEAAGRSVPYFTSALLMVAGFQGMILTADFFNLFVFLEIASLSGYALLSLGDRAAPVAALRYLLLGATGASLYLLGLWFVYGVTGSLNMADVAGIAVGAWDDPALVIGVSLMVVGIAVKMALWPLHGWLPDAYTYAPSSSSALVAPIGTKVGAYVLIRILLFVFTTGFVTDTIPITTVILWSSAVGIIYGSVMAIAQRELKRMLAYSSVAQIGYIGLGIGLANPLGLIGALLHVLNHALMKATLFLVTGNLRRTLGHSDIDRLDRETRRRLPGTTLAFTVAALSMIGIPPLAGFFSKWYLGAGAVDAGAWPMLVVILVSSLLNAVYFFRVIERLYLTPEPESESDEDERLTVTDDRPSATVGAAAGSLAVGIIVVGLFNVAVVTGILELIRPPGW
jgi:multicomponent Na+:H+ antiporter subunit D